MEKHKLDFITPISLNPRTSTAREVADSIIWQNKRFGVRKFAYFALSKGWRSIGYPPREEYIKCAEMAAEVKRLVKDYDVELGWFIALTVKSGASDEFVSPVRYDGTEHPFSSCLLDPAFRKRLAEDIALFVKIAQPSFLFTEDDFSLSAVSGCFCDNHLKEFAKRAGRYYTREELCEIILHTTPENSHLVRIWRQLSKDIHVEAARCIREETDKVNPNVKLGYMQAGGADVDGDVTEAVSRALAGGRHTPYSRLHGAFYGGANVKLLPQMLYHTLYSKQHIGDNFKFYHECDPYPHNKFYSSGKHMKAIAGTVISYGFDGAIFFMSAFSLKEKSTETTYGDMYAAEIKRFNEVYRIAKKCTLRGVEMDYDPFWNTADNDCSTQNPLWVKCISRFGIPYVTTESPVAFWDIRQAKYADYETILDRLSKVVFLDGDAARCLCERGYSGYLGVDVGENIVSDSMLSFDLGAKEVVKEQYTSEKAGFSMPCAHAFYPAGRGSNRRLGVIDDKCKVVSEIFTFENVKVSTAMTLFENKLGGKVITMGLTLDNNNSQSLFNYTRQKLIQKLITECCDEYIYVKDIPDMSIIVNEAKSGQSGFIGMITMINLCEDTAIGAELHLYGKWKDVKKVSVLTADAIWEEIPFEYTADGIFVKTDFEYCEPTYILFS